MKKIEVSDDVYAALERLATDSHRSPDEILASLLAVSRGDAHSTEPLAEFVTGAEFRAQPSEPDKYLALLNWIAARHRAELDEFIRGHSGGRRYLWLNREEIIEICRRNQARQIAGTPYWAIMNLEAAARRDFIARILDFIGYQDDVIDFVCAMLGGPRARRRRFALVA